MLIDNNCPICDRTTKSNIIRKDDSVLADCPRCGRYLITEPALTLFENTKLKDALVNVSYWIRKHQGNNRVPEINVKIITEILVPFCAQKPIEQINNLILWLGDNQKKLSEGTAVFYFDLVPIVGCYNEKEVEMIVTHLEKNRLIVLTDVSGLGLQELIATLTFTGWEKYYELKTTSADSKQVFMAMKFANVTLTKIFNKVIKDAVSKTGFEIRRLDEEKRAGLIDDKLRVEIRRSKFLIADLTDDNNGAYWEAGYAEGLGMPVIYICEEEKFKTKLTHFDTNHHLTVQWKDDPESLKKFAEELKATIRATFPAEAKMED